jgi:hypothetical protein
MSVESKLDWTEVAPAAQDIFRIWLTASSKEIDWANTAWIALGRSGLTGYSDEVQKTLVLVRFLTLGMLFREFCELARDEVFEPDMSEWTDVLEISPIRLGQILGPDALNEPDDQLDLQTAINELTDQHRAEVTSALLKSFGNESALFLSLWQASDGAEIEEPEQE